MLKSDKAALWL